MTQTEMDIRLKELKQKCSKCAEDAIGQGFGPINPKKCKGSCLIIKEIQELEIQQAKNLGYKGRKT